MRCKLLRTALVSAIAVGFPLLASAQTYTPLQQIPGAKDMRHMSRIAGSAGGGGTIGRVMWPVAGSRIFFEKDGVWQSVDLENGELNPSGAPKDGFGPAVDRPPAGEKRAGRGRQVAQETSPDGMFIAETVDGDVILRPTDAAAAAKPKRDASKGDRPRSGAKKTAAPVAAVVQEAKAKRITEDGGEGRIKYGTASWVYGEELDQTTAMWWSPDSSKLAFYRFDESKVKDYWLLGGLSTTRTALMSEAYPKPGEPNPTAEILVYDMKSGETTKVDSALPEDAEHYVYNLRWSPDGKELLFNRASRRQDFVEIVAANPSTGASRVVHRETQTAWQENRPLTRFLEDGVHFIFETEKNGFKNYEIRSLADDSVISVTTNDFPAHEIVLVDEKHGDLWYTAPIGASANAVQAQLHVAKLDGTGSTCVTSEPLSHSDFRIAPDGESVVATAESHSVPPRTVVYARRGEHAGLIATIATGDDSTLAAQGIRASELFTCKAADGVTDLYGELFFPPAFDETKSYPLIVDTYGGPTVQLVKDVWRPCNPHTALGFLIARVDNRGTPGRGKAFETATYRALGGADADDQAAAVSFLVSDRAYIDGKRVGITGHSYGGYMSAICIIRHPEVFAAAVAGAPVTDWRNYDSIYTERYMQLPAENAEGYDLGSCVKHAGNLKGKLLLLHGMVDDNVHPANTFELANALQSINRPFSMMAFANSEHGIWSPAVESVKWSFLVDALQPSPTRWVRPDANSGAGEESAAPSEGGA